MPLATLRNAAGAGASWCAIALGASIPLSVAADNLLIAAFLLLWSVSPDPGGRLRALRANPVALAALALAAVYFLGMSWSGLPPAQLRESAVDALRFVLLALFTGVFLDAATRRRAETAFLAASALVLLISYLLWFGVIDTLPGVKGRAGYPVVFKYHITHNVLMAVAALLFVMHAIGAARRSWKITLWLLAAAATINVFLVVPGRTGQLALAAAIVYLALARPRWRGLTAASTGFALLALGAWLGPNTVLHERTAKAWEEAAAWEPGRAQESTSSVGMRLEFYRNSIAMMRERPLFGAGTGAFRKAYEVQVRGKGMLVTDHPHNAFLHVGVELGLLGLGALIALLVIQWRCAGAMREFRDRTAARGLIVIFVVSGLVSSTFGDHAEGLFYAWAGALLFATARRADRA